MIIVDSFIPFFGVVEGIKDPEELGRIQVRCYGYHTENKAFIPSDMLRWFQSVVSNSAGVSGKGNSPTGYVKGSTVFGYFLSREMQDGIVIGAINGKPTTKALANMGFSDPDLVYPIFTNESDVNRLARNKSIEETIIQTKKDNVVTGVATAKGETWDEPATKYDAEYPLNNVFESESGHTIEIDDTPNKERLHVYHKSGSNYEIHPNGDQVVKIVGENYTIIYDDDHCYIDGNSICKITGEHDLNIDGNSHINVEGGAKITAPTIQLGEDDKVEPSILGDKLSAWINTELVPWLNTHNHIGNLGYPTSPAATGSVGLFDAGTAMPEGEIYSKVNKNQ